MKRKTKWAYRIEYIERDTKERVRETFDTRDEAAQWYNVMRARVIEGSIFNLRLLKTLSFR